VKKFLKAVRLDNSDAEMYQKNGACDEGEWVCSGGFAVCNIAEGYRCEPRCYCDASFISVTRRARATIAEVVEVSDADIEIIRDALTQHLMLDWRAPDYETARGVANEEIDYTIELCETFAPEVWITVQRAPSRAGREGALDEQYNQYERLQVGAHKV
jgi:hypothetical protein